MKPKTIDNSGMKKKRWLIMFAMCLGIVCVNAVPYSVRSYYDVFQQATGLTNQQLGQLMSAYGIGSVILYFPGGWIADKVSPRKLMAAGFFLGGILSLSILTFPSFGVLCAIFAAFAVSCNFLGWGAHVKLTSFLAGDGEQGKLLGAREAISGLCGLVIGFVVLGLGNIAGTSKATYEYYLILYAAFSFISGIMLLVLLKEDQMKGLQGAAVDLSYITRVLKMPQIWLMALIVIAAYTAYSAASYLSPYLVQVYGADVGASTAYGLLRSYGFRIFACSLLGLWADKNGSPTKLLTITTGIIALLSVSFLIVPGQASTYIIAVILMTLWGIVASGMRGIYYAQMGESGIPTEIRGTAIGFIALLAYTPDIYFYNMVGGWIDTAGVVAYDYMFYYVIGLSAICIGCGILLLKLNKKARLKAGLAK